MPEKIKLSSGLPLFVPRSRHAILFNNYDNFDEYSQASVSRGNRRVYDMEALLAGKFSRGPPQFEPGLSRILALSFSDVLDTYKRYERQQVPYASVSRVLPKIDMRGKLERVVKRISSVSSRDTLTFLYITSHGDVGRFVIDDKKRMSYENLLDRLDRIRGKKVIVAMACFSGSLIDVWRTRRTRDDYVVLSSTTNGEMGINWAEDQIDGAIWKNIADKKRFSDLVIPARVEACEGDADCQHPQIVGSFDVVL